MLAAAVLCGAYASSSHAQVSLPDTQIEILSAMRAKAALGGGRVLVAPGIIDVLDLRVPSNVTLVGSGALGLPTTTLRLRAKSDGRAVVVGLNTIGNAIENLIIDGNRLNQSPDKYTLVGDRQILVGRLAPLTLGCTNCAVRNVRVTNAMYDGVVLVASKNVVITKTTIAKTGRLGMNISQSTNVDVTYSKVEDTGIAVRYPGGGGGFGAGGSDIEFRFVETRRTNGDGVAAYTGSNVSMRVLDSIFYSPQNHCVHLGGDKPIIMRNKCYSPRLVGYYLANDWRPGAATARDHVGGRVIDNFVQNTQSDGVKVQWYIADTQVSGNTVHTSLNNNYGIYDSRGVSVTGNIGLWPATGRRGGDYCHLKIFNSKVVQSGNDFAYPNVTRPAVC